MHLCASMICLQCRIGPGSPMTRSLYQLNKRCPIKSWVLWRCSPPSTTQRAWRPARRPHFADDHGKVRPSAGGADEGESCTSQQRSTRRRRGHRREAKLKQTDKRGRIGKVGLEARAPVRKCGAFWRSCVLSIRGQINRISLWRARTRGFLAEHCCIGGSSRRLWRYGGRHPRGFGRAWDPYRDPQVERKGELKCTSRKTRGSAAPVCLRGW